MTEKKPTLCIVAGPNGSGKTSTTIQLLRYEWGDISNANLAISMVDRAYVYDNSIENQMPQLLFRTISGKMFKQYSNTIPEWAKMLVQK